MRGLIFLSVCLLSVTTVFTQSSQSGRDKDVTEKSNQSCPSKLPVDRADYQLTPCVGAYKLHTTALPWNNARHKCESEGAHLAIINSDKESEALKNLVAQSPRINGPSQNDIALGFHDLYAVYDFVTIYGENLEDVGFYRWAENGQNNAGGNERCGAMDRNGLLKDISCNLPVGFVCELPLKL